MSIARHVNLAAATGEVRYASYQSRKHLVVPVVALQVGVIHAVNAKNPELVSLECLSTCPASWDGRPVVHGHPTKDGGQISANDPTVLEQKAFGTVFNSQLKGPRLVMEAWIDSARAERLGAGRMLERIIAGDVVEVSVGAFVVLKNTVGVHNGKPFNGKWESVMPDHLAFLSEGVGACSVAMGCGTRAAEGSIPDGYALGLATRTAVASLDRKHHPLTNSDVAPPDETELLRSMMEFRTGYYESAVANLMAHDEKRIHLSIPDGYRAALDRMKETR